MSINSHTHTQMDAHVWGPHMHMLLHKCIQAHANMRTQQTTPCSTHTHKRTHKRSFRGHHRPPIHNSCARRLLCPRVSARSVLLSFKRIKRDVREVNATPYSASGEGDKALFNWKRERWMELIEDYWTKCWGVPVQERPFFIYIYFVGCLCVFKKPCTYNTKWRMLEKTEELLVYNKASSGVGKKTKINI